MRRITPVFDQAMRALLPLVDADTLAFQDYMAATALPRQTEEQAAARRDAMEAALKKAVEVPLSVLRTGDGCWEAMVEMARHGNLASRSDMEVGAKALEAGLWGAWRNVATNLAAIADEGFRDAARAEGEAIVQRARQRLEEVLAVLEER